MSSRVDPLEAHTARIVSVHCETACSAANRARTSRRQPSHQRTEAAEPPRKICWKSSCAATSARPHCSRRIPAPGTDLISQAPPTLSACRGPNAASWSCSRSTKPLDSSGRQIRRRTPAGTVHVTLGRMEEKGSIEPGALPWARVSTSCRIPTHRLIRCSQTRIRFPTSSALSCHETSGVYVACSRSVHVRTLQEGT
jgi:hypothetical protein